MTSGFLRSLTFNRDQGDLPRAFDQLELCIGGGPRLAGVESEGAEHLAILRQNRLGPRREYSIFEGKLSVRIGPDRIGGNVGDDDPPFKERGGAAATVARTNRAWTDCRQPTAWHAGAGGMPELLPIRIHQQDG